MKKRTARLGLGLVAAYLATGAVFYMKRRAEVAAKGGDPSHVPALVVPIWPVFLLGAVQK